MKNKENQTSVASKLKAHNKERKEKEKFILPRMWISTLISHFFTDRGTIPANIGNNILVTNNLIITKNSLTAVILVEEMSEITPLSWTSDLLHAVKEQVNGVVIDITFKGSRYHPDIAQSAIASREKTWHQTLDNPFMPKSYARRAARCLYTLDIARSGTTLTKQRIYIKVRAQDGNTLRRGIDAVAAYLFSIQAKHRRISSGIEEHLHYFTMMSDKKPKALKDIPPVVFSTQTFAESMPVIQGANDTKGVLMGHDTISGYPYFIDFKATAAAKNIMVEAGSGWGKTFLAAYWLYPFYASGFNLAIMDIKGNEFTALAKALKGIVLSMRPTSTYYINTFIWRPQEVFDGDYKTYANERIRMSKDRMLCMCDFDERNESLAEALFEEFLQHVYTSIGAMSTNVNTWSRTNHLTPYIIYDMFTKYVSNEVRIKYKVIIDSTIERLKMYMCERGSKSHLFRNAYSYLDILETQCLTFDFGLLENSGETDRVIFHLKVMDMVTINDEYVSYKKRKGQWTVKLLEESQVVDDWLTRVYTKEITLRRAQNQCTVLLGNSIAALASNPISKPIIENINILCLGSLTKNSRDFLINEYGLKDSEREMLTEIQTNPDMQRKFLLINRMEAHATTAILEANVPVEVSNSDLFRVVDTE